MFVGFITFQKERYFMFLFFFFFSFYKLLGPSCPACLLADYFIRDEGLEIYFIKCAVGIDQIICFFFLSSVWNGSLYQKSKIYIVI